MANKMEHEIDKGDCVGVGLLAGVLGFKTDVLGCKESLRVGPSQIR